MVMAMVEGTRVLVDGGCDGSGAEGSLRGLL